MAESNKIKINIKQSSDKNFEVEISLTDTVKDLKEKCKIETNVEVANQKIIFKGKILKDGDQLQNLKVENGSTMHLVANKVVETSEQEKKAEVQNQQQTSQQSQGNTQSNQQQQQQNQFGNLGLGMPGFGFGGGFGNFGQGGNMGGLGGMGGLGLGGMGGMQGLNFNEIMNNPQMNQMIQSVMSNPQMLQNIIQSNPMLNQMLQNNPQLMTMFQDPQMQQMMQQMMSDPNMMSQALGQMGNMQNLFGGMQGMGGMGGFSLPVQQQQQQPQQQNNASTSQNQENKTTENKATESQNEPQNQQNQNQNQNQNQSQNQNQNSQQQQNQQMPDFNQFLQSVMGGQGGGMNMNNFDFNQLNSLLGGGFPMPQQQPVGDPNQPPEQRYKDQLQQMKEMGFTNTQTNLQALIATQGNVEAAVERILSMLD